MAENQKKTWASVIASVSALVVALVALFTKGGDPEQERNDAINAGLNVAGDVVEVITQPKADEVIVEEVVEPTPEGE